MIKLFFKIPSPFFHSVKEIILDRMLELSLAFRNFRMEPNSKLPGKYISSI
jgi:hypothetical protein